MPNSNHYFETPYGIQGELTDEVIVKRMAECSAVVNEIAKSGVWKVLLNDAQSAIKMLDDSWQDLHDGDVKMREMRILKMAYKHIFDLPVKYAIELGKLEEELAKRQSPEEQIQKDVDNEN